MGSFGHDPLTACCRRCAVHPVECCLQRGRALPESRNGLWRCGPPDCGGHRADGRSRHTSMTIFDNDRRGDALQGSDLASCAAAWSTDVEARHSPLQVGSSISTMKRIASERSITARPSSPKLGDLLTKSVRSEFSVHTDARQPIIRKFDFVRAQHPAPRDGIQRLPKPAGRWCIGSRIR